LESEFLLFCNSDRDLKYILTSSTHHCDLEYDEAKGAGAAQELGEHHRVEYIFQFPNEPEKLVIVLTWY
jgi:hypothetical protein